MNDIESNEERLARALARKNAIWIELRARFAEQAERREREAEQRAEEDAREDELRRELDTLESAIRTQHHTEHADPLAGVENEP